MKTQKFSKKLNLKKSTISALSMPQMKDIQGGANSMIVTCSVYPNYCPKPNIDISIKVCA